MQSDRFSTDTVPGGTQVIFAAGHVVITCPARGIVVKGDSAERRPDGEHMIGNTIYDDPRIHVTSDFLNYLTTDERVIAVGNVKARLPSGSTMQGPLAEWQRVTPTRKMERFIARSRPTIDLVRKDSTTRRPAGAAPTSDTTRVVAEHVEMDGDSSVYAGGQVVITRSDISATADSVFLDQSKETMHLMRDPEMHGKRERSYSLKGDLIDVYSKDRKVQRVISRANAIATSDSMTLKSDTIDLRVKDDLLEHAYAWGRKSQAHATSPSDNLVADSLDVTMPAQKVRLIRALGHAIAHGKPDTARFKVEKPDTTDWLRGDTITAHFDTVATKDTSRTPPIRQLFALGHAASWYHMAASDSGERRPSVHYSTAKRITIDFDKQKVATVTEVDSVVGVYIEPKPDSASRRRNAAPAPATGSGSTAKPATPTQPPKPPATPSSAASGSAPLNPKRP